MFSRRAPPNVEIPETFARTMRVLYEAAGEDWLAHLPDLIAECEARWDLRVLPPFALSYNYVAPAVRSDGTQVVLKLGVPNPDLTSEIEALRAYAGRGMCGLIGADAARGIALLERVTPGVMLSTLSPGEDERATSIAAGVMDRLWCSAPAGHTFRGLESWTSGLLELRPAFDGGAGPFPEPLVARALSLREQLLLSSREETLLHGDLHHFNILQGQADWLAIDPKGVVGERAYETASFLYNPMSGDITPVMLTRRIDIFTERLSLARERVLGWGLVQAMLSAWWTYSGEKELDTRMLAFAETIAALA